MFAGKLHCIHVFMYCMRCVGGWVCIQCSFYSEPDGATWTKHLNQMEESMGDGTIKLRQMLTLLAFKTHFLAYTLF